MERFSSFAQVYLRLTIGTAYLVFGLDRLGAWGKYGTRNVSWGDWQHFQKYAAEVMSFLPLPFVNVLAIIATFCEIGFGIMLLTGLWTRVAALGSGILALLFAISMAISFGLICPLSYSVFTVSAASFLLATSNDYIWSLENFFVKREAY